MISDETKARALLEEACASAGLDPRDARLMRLGSNAVFRLQEPVVVRIARSEVEMPHVRRTIAVARWLESEDYPAVRALDFDQPIIVDGYPASFWEAVSLIGNEWTSVAEIAELLVKLHKLAAPDELRLPEVTPFAKAEERISANTWLTPEKRRTLADKLAELQYRYARLDWALSIGVIHGDAGAGNTLRDWNGRPVMIDLDNFAIGHREWDLILTAVYYDSFGWHTTQEYEEFAQAYGFDIMKWSGYSTLKELSEFLMVTWVITKAGESQRVADEASKRIESLRTGASRKDWAPLLRARRQRGLEDGPRLGLESEEGVVLSELATIRRYPYFSERRACSIAGDNSINFERRWLFDVQLPSLLGFLPQIGITERDRIVRRDEMAVKLERSIGQLAVEDFVTPPPARFIKGRGPVTIAAYTRWRPHTKAERKGIIIHTRTTSSTGTRVEVCLFGSVDNCSDYLAGSEIETPVWSSSSTWAIEEFITNRGTVPAPVYDDDESIAVEIVRVFNNEGMNGAYAFKRLPSAEWFAEVYHDVELDKERWNQRIAGDWPQPVDRIVIGAPLWVRTDS